VFDTTKLEWMNGQYLSMLPVEALDGPVRDRLRELGVDPGSADLGRMIDVVKARARTVTMVAEMIAVRLPGAHVTRDVKGNALAEKLGERFDRAIALAAAALEALPQDAWRPESLETELKALAEREQFKLGDLMQPIRVALTGGTVSEPVHELLAVVGRDEALRRLQG
jgi:glutamyl-tRNA synthetase